MSRHEKPGRTLGHTHSPHFPFPQSGEEGTPSHSPPLSQYTHSPSPLPLQPPGLIRESLQQAPKRQSKHWQSTETERDAETHSKDTPGILAAPSHTASTQGESGGEGFHSHKDDTKQTK